MSSIPVLLRQGRESGLERLPFSLPSTLNKSPLLFGCHMLLGVSSWRGFSRGVDIYVALGFPLCLFEGFPSVYLWFSVIVGVSSVSVV